MLSSHEWAPKNKSRSTFWLLIFKQLAQLPTSRRNSQSKQDEVVLSGLAQASLMAVEEAAWNPGAREMKVRTERVLTEECWQTLSRSGLHVRFSRQPPNQRSTIKRGSRGWRGYRGASNLCAQHNERIAAHGLNRSGENLLHMQQPQQVGDERGGKQREPYVVLNVCTG